VDLARLGKGRRGANRPSLQFGVAPTRRGRGRAFIHSLDAAAASAHLALQANRLGWHVHGMACLLIDGPLAVQFPTEKTREGHLREVGRKFAGLVMSSA